ncbi:unnamed protein product [Lampetra planeri]
MRTDWFQWQQGDTSGCKRSAAFNRSTPTCGETPTCQFAISAASERSPNPSPQNPPDQSCRLAPNHHAHATFPGALQRRRRHRSSESSVAGAVGCVRAAARLRLGPKVRSTCPVPLQPAVPALVT